MHASSLENWACLAWESKLARTTNSFHYVFALWGVSPFQLLRSSCFHHNVASFCNFPKAPSQATNSVEAHTTLQLWTQGPDTLNPRPRKYWMRVYLPGRHPFLSGTEASLLHNNLYPLQPISSWLRVLSVSGILLPPFIGGPICATSVHVIFLGNVLLLNSFKSEGTQVNELTLALSC